MKQMKHIRAARALLGWSAERLAAEVGVSLRTIQRFENGQDLLPIVSNAIMTSLALNGVEFIPGGVRLREMGEAAE